MVLRKLCSIWIQNLGINILLSCWLFSSVQIDWDPGTVGRTWFCNASQHLKLEVKTFSMARAPTSVKCNADWSVWIVKIPGFGKIAIL